MSKTVDKNIKIILSSPRGFCAGVERAVKIVELALEKHGRPVYVRHEIVHNKFVVDSLKNKGAIFVEELSEIPVGSDRPVIFSAHGVAKEVVTSAQERELFYIDATCPLVSRVHRDAERHHKNGRTIILVGHVGHPEVIGTMGQLPKGSAVLVQNVEDVDKLSFPEGTKLAWCSQTTLSVDDTADIVKKLESKFIGIEAPAGDNICYATTNRQEAVKQLAKEANIFFVIGARNSSNSNRLVEVAKRHGCEKAYLISGYEDIDWELLQDNDTIGITAGASAPEILVEEVIREAKSRFNVCVEPRVIIEENVIFQVPKSLR